MTYLLDANVFIQAKNLHYGFEFCPAFWDWIDDQTNAGSVYSIERIADELLVEPMNSPTGRETDRRCSSSPMSRSFRASGL